MKILYVTQWFSPIGGGGEVQFINLIDGITNKGHIAHVICEQNLGIENEIQMDNLYVHRVGPVLNGPKLYLNQNIRFIINAIRKGLQLIKEEKIDLLHVNNYSPVIIGSVLSKIKHVPLIKTIHAVYCTSPDFWKNWSTQNNVSSVLRIVGTPFEKITIRLHSDIIHTVSNATKREVIKYNSKSRIVVIPNGVNLSEFENLDSNTYQKYVLFIGRLVVNKSLEVVISSFNEVVKKIPDARLIVLGSGPMEDAWKKTTLDLGLHQSIEFMGYVSEEKKLELLRNCSALVLPSTVEGQGIAALEALAMSKPILLSDIEPSYEIVSNGIDGFIIPNQPEKWSEGIILLLSNMQLCKRMGNAGRIKVEKNYPLQRLVNEMELTYLELLKSYT